MKLDMSSELNKCHEVERFENVMHNKCELHWHCIYCDGFWPLYCYGKKDLEQIECPAKRKQYDALTKLEG